MLFSLPITTIIEIYHGLKKRKKVKASEESIRHSSNKPPIVKREEALEKDTLFDDWKQFITLYPEEKIVHAYRDVNALYNADEIWDARKGIIANHRGDLVLTNRRLAYLEYRYEKASFTLKMKLISVLAFLFFMIAIIGVIASGLLLIPIALICLILLSKILKRFERPPVGYSIMGFETLLKNIVETRWDTSLKDFLEIGTIHRKSPILVHFRNIQEANEFRKNLSYLVYDAQHHPKEIIQYSVVTRFDLGKDNAISVQCPYCGASAPLRSKESKVTCNYCGKQYIIPRKILDLIG